MENKDKIILDLCGGTGSWSKPYRDAGYTVYNITLPTFDILETKFAHDDGMIFQMHDDGGGLFVKYEDVYGILAAPPCTMFSMARTVAKIPRDLRGAMAVVEMCLRIVWECQFNGRRLAFWALENPKARLRWFLGHPALTFNPFEFGDAYRKPTDIWGNFNKELRRNIVKLNPKQRKQSQLNVQELQPIPADYIRDPNMSPRAVARSITHSGFAEVFFKANK